VELALASRTAPSAWWRETDETIATAILILRERAARMRR
jgi:hypothetical protein